MERAIELANDNLVCFNLFNDMIKEGGSYCEGKFVHFIVDLYKQRVSDSQKVLMGELAPRLGAPSNSSDLGIVRMQRSAEVFHPLQGKLRVHHVKLFFLLLEGPLVVSGEEVAKFQLFFILSLHILNHYRDPSLA